MVCTTDQWTAPNQVVLPGDPGGDRGDVSVRIDDAVLTVVDERFTYKDDPEISDAQPRTIILRLVLAIRDDGAQAEELSNVPGSYLFIYSYFKI